MPYREAKFWIVLLVIIVFLLMGGFSKRQTPLLAMTSSIQIAGEFGWRY